MNFTRFFGLGAALAIASAFLTIVFVRYINLPEMVGNYVLWACLLIFTTAVVRRLGVINFLESFLTAGVWLFFRLLFDALVTAPILGVGIYGRVQLWVGYAVMVAAILLLHKKRHIHIRHEMRKHHH